MGTENGNGPQIPITKVPALLPHPAAPSITPIAVVPVSPDLKLVQLHVSVPGATVTTFLQHEDARRLATDLLTAAEECKGSGLTVIEKETRLIIPPSAEVAKEEGGDPQE